jgi:hypothetical protein
MGLGLAHNYAGGRWGFDEDAFGGPRPTSGPADAYERVVIDDAPAAAQWASVLGSAHHPA